MYDLPGIWLDALIVWLAGLMPVDSIFHYDFTVRALLAVLIVSLLCGAMGSMVVGCRMAFFSDALAHCAFAGVALGLLIGLIAGVLSDDFRHWITFIMVVFGVIIGLLIVYVRERTGLSSDTVIGVFFAAAVGLGGIFERAARGKSYFQLERFLFGEPVTVTANEILWLMLMVPVIAAYMWWLYNPLVFAHFNPSLARSRQLQIRLANYLFVGLLALVINLCVQIVGVLLISGLLIVPGAAAINLSRNMRQFFWSTIGISVCSGILGCWINFEMPIYDPSAPGRRIWFGLSGTVVVCSVLFFVASMLWSRRVHAR